MGGRLYLLGHPISHSKSPAMYNAVYESMGADWRYELADIATEAEARAFLDAREFASINITTPYKPLAFEYATAKAASAKLARGANLLVRKGDALIAFNTDGEGCVDYLRRCGFAFSGASVVVCGTGPTSLAILHACAVAGAADVVLMGRDKDRTKAALARYIETFGELAYSAIDVSAAADGGGRTFRRAYEDTRFRYGCYETSRTAIAEADLIVNATPLGMNAGDPAPFDVSLIGARQTVFDCVYGHGETALLAAARAAGARALDGAGMLVAQAVATVRIVSDLVGLEGVPDADALFSLMADAAGFDLPL